MRAMHINEGDDREAVFNRVMGAVRRANAAELDAFTQKCREYGKAVCDSEEALQVCTSSFYDFLIQRVAVADMDTFVPDLLQLVPSANKQRALREHHAQVSAAVVVPTLSSAAAAPPSAPAGAQPRPPTVPAPLPPPIAVAAPQPTPAPAAGNGGTNTAASASPAAEPEPERDPLAPLIAELRELDVWAYDSAECAERKEVLRRVTQYVEGMCHWEETVVKAWHVTSINEWNKHQARVLVLCSRSYFRVQFDDASGRIVAPITRIAMADVTRAECCGSGAGPAVRVHSSKTDGNTWGPWSNAGAGGGSARTYAPVVPREGPSADSVALEIRHGIETVLGQAQNEGEVQSKLMHFRRLMIQGIEVYRHLEAGDDCRSDGSGGDGGSGDGGDSGGGGSGAGSGSGSGDGTARRELWVLHLDAEGTSLMLGLKKNHANAIVMALPEIRSVEPDSSQQLCFIIHHPLQPALRIEVDTAKSRRIVCELMNKIIARAKHG
eukprot:g4350.t1